MLWEEGLGQGEGTELTVFLPSSNPHGHPWFHFINKPFTQNHRATVRPEQDSGQLSSLRNPGLYRTINNSKVSYLPFLPVPGAPISVQGVQEVLETMKQCLLNILKTLGSSPAP